jgi:chaperonin cofactor prefoldin
MIKEVIDKGSGAILFKKDSESLTLEDLMKRVDRLESENNKLKKRIEILEKGLF